MTANDYFDTADFTAMTRNTRALAEAVMAALAAVENGFALLPGNIALRQNKQTFVASDTGTANAYVVSLTQAPPAYSDGLLLRFRVANTNTSSSTINVNSLGLKDIRNYAGTALTGGELIQGSQATLWYDNTNGYFRIVSPLIDVASVTTFDIDNLTAETSVATDDYVPIQDTSAGAKRKMTRSNFLGTTLATIAALTPTANTVITYGASTTAQLSGITSAALSVLDDTTVAAMLTTLGAVGQGTVEIPLPASCWRAPTTNGASYDNTETSTNDIPIEGWNFDQTTEEAIWTSVRLPKSVDESSTISFAVQWTASSGTATHTFIAKFAIVALGDDEALDTAVGTAQTCTDALITTSRLHLSPTSSGVTPNNSWAEGDMLYIKLSRDVGNDTIAADVKVTHVSMYVTTNAVTDA